MKLLRTKNLRNPLYSIGRQIDIKENFNYIILDDHECISVELNSSNLNNTINVLKSITKIRKEVEAGKQVYFNINNGISFKITKEGEYYYLDNCEILLNYIIIDIMKNSEEFSVSIYRNGKKFLNNIKVKKGMEEEFFLTNMKDSTYEKIVEIVDKIKYEINHADYIEIANEKEIFKFEIIQYIK